MAPRKPAAGRSVPKPPPSQGNKAGPIGRKPAPGRTPPPVPPKPPGKIPKPPVGRIKPTPYKKK